MAMIHGRLGKHRSRERNNGRPDRTEEGVQARRHGLCRCLKLGPSRSPQLQDEMLRDHRCHGCL